MRQVSPRLLGTVFLATLLVQLVGSVLYFYLLTDAVWIQPVYGATKVLMVLAPLVLLRYALPLPKLNIHHQPGRAAGLGLLSGLAISGAIYLSYLFLLPVLQPSTTLIAAKVDALGIAAYYLPVALGISLLHSLFEEYFWRWYAVGGLANVVAPRTAILLGAAFFSAHHFVVLSQFFPILWTLIFGIGVGVGGLIWSALYRRTGSLLAPWISHALTDGTLFYIGYLLIHG